MLACDAPHRSELGTAGVPAVADQPSASAPPPCIWTTASGTHDAELKASTLCRKRCAFRGRAGAHGRGARPCAWRAAKRCRVWDETSLIVASLHGLSPNVEAQSSTSKQARTPTPHPPRSGGATAATSPEPCVLAGRAHLRWQGDPRRWQHPASDEPSRTRLRGRTRVAPLHACMVLARLGALFAMPLTPLALPPNASGRRHEPTTAPPPFPG